MFVSTGSCPFRSHHLLCFPGVALFRCITPTARRVALSPSAVLARYSHTATAECSLLCTVACVRLLTTFAGITAWRLSQGGVETPLSLTVQNLKPRERGHGICQIRARILSVEKDIVLMVKTPLTNAFRGLLNAFCTQFSSLMSLLTDLQTKPQ
jgi:hypothetical protein